MQTLIVFSGLDGAGKSTQIKLLQAEFQKRGLPVTCLWSRGGYTPIFNAMKSLVRHVSGRRILPESGHSAQRSRSLANPLIQKTWLLLAIVDLFFLYSFWLRGLMLGGRTIICDRYVADTLLDFRLNFPNVQFERWPVWKLLVALSPKPNAAFLVLIPIEESVRRSHAKGEPFPDTRETLASRLSAYQNLAAHVHWQVLDGCQSIEELSILIRRRVFAE